MTTAKTKPQSPQVIAYDPTRGFTGKELRDYLGYTSSSFPTGATKKAKDNGDDFIVATKADPINQRWQFEGKKGNYRYFRMEQ